MHYVNITSFQDLLYVPSPEEAQYKVPCEVNFHLQLAIVLRVVVLYLQ